MNHGSIFERRECEGGKRLEGIIAAVEPFLAYHLHKKTVSFSISFCRMTSSPCGQCRISSHGQLLQIVYASADPTRKNRFKQRREFGACTGDGPTNCFWF